MVNCTKYKENIIGERFGKLVVISEAPKEEWKNKNIREYLCKCDCGKTANKKGPDLVRNRIKSCGCLRRETMIRIATKYDDSFIGKKFGRLTIESEVSRAEWEKDGYKEYFCICDCGKRIKAVGITLVSGNTKSCGCLNKERQLNQWKDISGQVFGELTAIRKAENHYSKSGYRSTMWLFKCSCGREVVLNWGNVRSGKQKSCGHIGRSMAEYKIGKWLDSRNIKYEQETIFDDLLNPLTGHVLYFDFKIYRNDGSFFLIEHQGEQHFTENWQGFGDQQRKHTDKMKKDYCKSKGITLYETLYNEDYIAKLQDIVKKELRLEGDDYEKGVKCG